MSGRDVEAERREDDGQSGAGRLGSVRWPCRERWRCAAHDEEDEAEAERVAASSEASRSEHAGFLAPSHEDPRWRSRPGANARDKSSFPPP
mgnify:CR=1 FL=1